MSRNINRKKRNEVKEKQRTGKMIGKKQSVIGREIEDEEESEEKGIESDQKAQNKIYVEEIIGFKCVQKIKMEKGKRKKHEKKIERKKKPWEMKSNNTKRKRRREGG